MLDVDHITLRDLLKKTMANKNLSAKDVAEKMGTNAQNIYNFLAGRVTSPYSDTWEKVETFLMDNGVGRSSILGQITPKKRRKRGEYKKHPEIIEAVEFLKQFIQDNPHIKKNQLAKEIGFSCPHSISPSGLRNINGKAVTKNTKALVRWFREKTNQQPMTEQAALEKIFGSVSGANAAQKPAEQQFEMSNKQEGRHYVCAFIDDWETANLIGAIASTDMTENQKKSMLHKLFPSLFPTL